MIPDMSRASHDELIAEIEDLKKQLDVIHASEQEFLNAVQHALDQREAGEHARLNPGSYSDGLKDLAFAVNNALEQGEKQEEKARFYRNILESLPVPISVTDLNEKWTYINENLESMSNLHREDVLGMNCSGWGTNICNTEQCAIKALKRGETESVFEHGRGHYKTLASYLQDPDGNAIGHVVVIVDIADMVWITDYTKKANAALLSNLEQAIHGNFAFASPLPDLPSNRAKNSALIEYEEIVHKQFKDVFENLEIWIQCILSDVQDMTMAIHEGRFDYRTDVSKYEGRFQQIIGRMNELLDFIFKPVHDTIRVCGCYAAGDFTARTDPHGVAEGEWKDWKTSLDKIGIDVSQQLQLIVKQMHELSLLTEQARESMKGGMGGTEQMLEMAEQIGQSSSEGSEHIAQVVKVMEDLSFSFGETAMRSQQVSHSASQASEYAGAGMEQTEKSGLVMEGITDSARVLEVIIKDINVQMAEIGKIVQLISDISNQTNLLALNAAIEAARAGDAGRGFAVVASEVKALAQDSRRSAENITDMISSLKEKTIKADQATNQASTVVQQGKAAVDENLAMLNNIVTSISDINHNAVDVASFVEEQVGAIEDVTMSIATISDRIKHTVKRVGQMSTTAEETGAAITEIGEIFDEIYFITKEISGKIAQFQLNESDPAIAPFQLNENEPT